MSVCSHGACTRRPHVAGRGLCETHARLAGLLRRQIPHEVALVLVQMKLNLGYSPAGLSRELGMRHDTIGKFLRLRSPMKASTFDALLEVEAPGRVEGWRVIRRLQALRAAGATVRELAEGIGVSVDYIHSLHQRDPEWVAADYAKRIIDYYRAHEMDTVRPVDWRVARRGWALPLEWDDIDDPDEVPGGRREVTDVDRRAAETLVSRVGVARAVEIVGMSESALKRFRRGVVLTAKSSALDRLHAAVGEAA